MVVIYGSEFLEVKVMSLIADYDRETLTNLYQPIIGHSALAVYFTLWSEGNNQKVTSLTTHGQLIRRMKMAMGDFINARKTLEAVGLLKSFVSEQEDSKLYTYEIYAPKTPNKFFDDALLFGMFIKELGETEANKFKAMYKFENMEDSGKDISASFVEVFNPNFDDPAFIKALEGNPSLGRHSGKIVSEFSYEIFFNHLKEISQIKEDAFTKKDMKEIERLATLNGVNEINAANCVAKIYDAYAGKGKHIDYARLTHLFQEDETIPYIKNSGEDQQDPNYNSGKTELAKKINLMESVSPKQYLSILQNGTKPAFADLRLVDSLSKNFNLPNCVINALVDFALAMNGNVLSRSYCEKIAASLAREGVQTTIDAMNFLRNANKKTPKSGKIKKERQNIEVAKVSKKTEEDDVSWEQLLDDIDDEGANGKA